MPRKKKGNSIPDDDRRHIAEVIARYNTPGLIKTERKKRGWTQDILAAEMGLSVRYIVQLEKGQKPVSQMLSLAFHGLFTVRFPLPDDLPKTNRNPVMAYNVPVTDLSLLFDAIRSLARIKAPKTVNNTLATVPFEGIVAIAVKLDVYCKERELHPSQLLNHLTELSKAKPTSPRGNNDWQRYNVSPLAEDGLFDQDEADFLKEIDPEFVANSINDDIQKLTDWMNVWNPDGTHVDVELGIMLSAEARMRWDLRKHAEFLLAVVEYRRANNYPPAAFETAVPSLIERLRPYHEGLDLNGFFQQHAALASQKLKAMEQGEELDFGGPGIPRAEFERRQAEAQEKPE